MKFPKSLRFPNSGNLILDSIGESVVEMVSEGPFAVILNLGCKAIEFNNIFVDVLAIFHRKMVKLIFSITNRAVWAEIDLELKDEFLIVIHPVQAKHCVAQLEEVGFEPLEGHTLEVGL
jgi:hypothetical protein